MTPAGTRPAAPLDRSPPGGGLTPAVVGPWLGQIAAALAFADHDGTGGAEDAYAPAFLPGLMAFYRAAAQDGLAAIFTVDQ